MNKIELDGTHNTRDLGGYETQDGRVIKEGFLFRSDGLGKLTPEDCKKLSNLGIKRIVDFRSEVEKNKQPNIIPTGMEYIEMPIEADKNMNNEIYDILSGRVDKDMREFLIEANKDFVLQYKEVFSEFLKDLIKSGLPTLFHCTAGKDRTGFATFLIYTILGIERDTILVDYLKTNYFIQDSMKKQLTNVAKLMNIKETYPHLIKSIRGRGFLIGIQLQKDQTIFIRKLMENRLLTIRASENVVRILPPLNVKKSELDLSLKIINKVCKELN